MKQYRLMIPGPVDVPDEILEVMASCSLPHYGDHWLRIYDETQSYLQQVFGTQDLLFIMPGPGSAASEAAVSSLLASGEKALLLSNGFFAERLGQICRACGIETSILAAPWGQPILPEQVDAALRAETGIHAVVAIHHETSTGVLNPLKEIAEVAHAHGLPVVVDAISSIGGVPLPVDEWGIEVCISVGNKCLEAPPGVALISVSDRAWEIIDAKAPERRGWYLNLSTWKQYATDWVWHPYPTTVPTNVILALHSSLQNILADGIQVRYARFQEASALVRDGLRDMGFAFLVEDAYACPLVTAVMGKPGISVDDLAQYLRDECGILIAGGIGDLRGKMLRIGHMGKAVSEAYGRDLLAGVEAYLRRDAS